MSRFETRKNTIAVTTPALNRSSAPPTLAEFRTKNDLAARRYYPSLHAASDKQGKTPVAARNEHLVSGKHASFSD
ncbi:MAG: hypothetical protein ACR2OA_02435 [Rubripirellula sp.]